jgi:hypothetical protein
VSAWLRDEVAALEPHTAFTRCQCAGGWHTGPGGQCSHQGVDADGLYVCDCPAFQTADDDSAAKGVG